MKVGGSVCWVVGKCFCAEICSRNDGVVVSDVSGWVESDFGDGIDIDSGDGFGSVDGEKV